jgi:ABC-type lipoprotein export system ATPase subunit
MNMRAVLTISQLRKSYLTPSGAFAPIINVANFSLAVGAQVALAGSSGSGKTTFLHLIAGILSPDSGEIEISGTRMTALSEAKRDRLRAQSLGYVFQTFNLLQGFTALENVQLGMAFGKGVDTRYARELLDRVGLADRLHYRPRQLSVGQQQRVAVARALANRPSLVLADEPTGNLDQQHALESLVLIREVCREQQAALLLVSHDPAVLGEFEKVQSLAELNQVSTSLTNQ